MTAWIRTSILTDWREVVADLERSSYGRFDTVLSDIDKFLADKPEKIRLDAFVAILERVGRITPDAGLAWNTGQATRYSMESDFGKAILGCKTLGAGLHWLAHFFPLVQDATSLKLEVAEDWSTLSYKILDPAIWPRHQDAVYSLGIYSRLIRDAAPDAWRHAQLTLEAEQDAAGADLGKLVNTRVVYGANTNSVRFPTSVLEGPLNIVPGYDSSVIKRLSRELTRKHRSRPIGERCREMIFNEMNEGCVSQDHIARELGVSSRTLRRKLSMEELSYQSLLDDCRMQFAALEFRTRRRLSLSDMALRLGYSEHSTFSRAFSRWAGMAPQEYRRSVAVH